MHSAIHAPHCRSGKFRLGSLRGQGAAWIALVVVSLFVATPEAMALNDDCSLNEDAKNGIDACTASIETGDESADVYFYRGSHYAKDGEQARALADFAKAIEIEPTHSDALAARAQLYFDAGEQALSLEDANRAITLDAASSLALETRGRILEAQGKIADALKDFHTAVLVDPSRALARHGLRRLNGAELTVPECRKTETTAASGNDRDTLKVVNCLTYNDSGQPLTLEIGSLKIDELATSALLHDWIPEELAAQLGRRRDIVRTEVYDEISRVTEMFSENGVGFARADAIDLIGPGIDWSVQAGDPKYSEVLLGLTRYGAINSGIGNVRYEIAPPEEVLESLATTAWPDGAQFWFGETAEAYGRSVNDDGRYEGPLLQFALRKRDAMHNAVIWRYMRPGDLANFYEDQVLFQSKLHLAAGKQDRTVPASIYYDQASFRASAEFGIPRYVEAMKYFGRAEFPPDLGVVFGGIQHGSWESYFFPRHVMLELNIVKNTSDVPVEIRQFGLVRGLDVQIRRLHESARPEGTPSVVARDDDQTWLLEPGKWLLIPVRITLEYDGSVERALSKQAAGEIYKSIAANDADTLFEYNSYENWFDLLWSEPLMRKRGGSFSAPHAPNIAPYVHDAELRLAYIETSRGRLWPDGFEPASLSFTVRTAGFQCPFLEAWNAETRQFDTLGRILVSANNDYEGRHETVDLLRPTFRFRISERELEVSYIDQVALEATTKNGRTLWLEPDGDTLKREDGVAEVLHQGEAVDFTFALPSNVSEGEIVRTSLHVRGRYDRYGKLLLQSQLQQRNRGTPMPPRR